MGHAHILDLKDLDPTAFRRLADIVRFAKGGGIAAEIDETGRRICVRTENPAVVGYVDDLVADTRRAQARVRTKLLYKSSARWLAAEDIDLMLERSRDVLKLGPGLIGLRGELLTLFRFFERTFLRLARRYDAEEHHYPVLLPIDILEEVQYFSHFPQHVTFCGHLPEDLPLLESFAREVKCGGGRLPAGTERRLARLAHALKPAVCLPCYGQHRGAVFERERVETVTMQNHVFRYEGANVRSLARLWDFSVRDVVFFGRREEVERLRREVMRWSIGLCRRLDLEARVEQANDPFFLDQSRDKIVYQRMGDVKYELLVRLPARDEDLAVASFNLHRDFYSSVYDMRFEDGELIETACMGFGLERWMYAFLAQKGLEPRNWPKRVLVGSRGNGAEPGAGWRADSVGEGRGRKPTKTSRRHRA